MPLIYITGISGSGKSSISNKLKERGYEAYDADREGFNGWVNNKTGQTITRDDSLEYATPEWYEKYSWKTSRAKVEELAKRAKVRS
jgi:broad-specificity NMP kinase